MKLQLALMIVRENSFSSSGISLCLFDVFGVLMYNMYNTPVSRQRVIW